MSTRTPAILLVDDQQEILDLHCEILRDDGYRLVVARTADEAFQRIEKEFFDLLILDDRLEERPKSRTGRDFLRACRERDPDIGAVFVSAFFDQETLTDVIRLGACDYIVKGGSHMVERLRFAVRRALELTDTQRNGVGSVLGWSGKWRRRN